MENGVSVTNGSQQGQNRTEVIRNISEVSKDPFQALSQLDNQSREFSGSKVSYDPQGVGFKEANTGEATRAPDIPEAGKGSIANIVL